MRSLGWAVIQDDWCPYKKVKVGHRDRDDMKKIQEGSYLQAKERGLGQILLIHSLEGTNLANILF